MAVCGGGRHSHGRAHVRRLHSGRKSAARGRIPATAGPEKANGELFRTKNSRKRARFHEPAKTARGDPVSPYRVLIISR